MGQVFSLTFDKSDLESSSDADISEQAFASEVGLSEPKGFSDIDGLSSDNDNNGQASSSNNDENGQGSSSNNGEINEVESSKYLRTERVYSSKNDKTSEDITSKNPRTEEEDDFRGPLGRISPSKKRSYLIILSVVIITILLAIIIPLSVHFTLRGTKTSSSSSTTLSFSTTFSTTEEKIDYIIKLTFPESEYENAIGTPQYKAFNWLVTSYYNDTNNSDDLLQESKKILPQFVLKTLYYSTVDEDDEFGGWIEKDNWVNGSSEECDWYGIMCAADGDVVGINLSNNHLVGGIPSELTALKGLIKLEFSYNELTSISSSIGRFDKLSSLEIHHNDMMGQLPSEVIEISHNLLTDDEKAVIEILSPTFMELEQNIFVRSAQYEAFKWVVNHAAAFDNLDGCQNKMAQQYSLSTLFFATNGQHWNRKENWENDQDECNWNWVYTGGFTRGISCNKAGEVTSMKLGINNMEGTIPIEIGYLTSLTWLDLSHNYLDNFIVSEIGQLTNLSGLFLQGNRITGTIPSSFAQLTNLKYLRLDHTELSGTIPIELYNNTWKVSRSGNILGPTVDCDRVECEFCSCL